MDISEIIELFDFHGIVKSNARFDERKMAHFNTEHIRALPAAEFVELAKKAVKTESDIDMGGDEAYVEKVFAYASRKLQTWRAFPRW